MDRKQSSTFSAMLRAAGLRQTPARAGVLKILYGKTAPLDAATILSQFSKPTDEVTVYRTLNTLTAKNLIHRVRGADRSWRYALDRPGEESAHVHPHFICDDCGKVECLEISMAPQKSLSSIAGKRDYAVRHTEILLHGSCPACNSGRLARG